MPRSKETNQKIREDRMKAIINATIRVYASKGYLGAQMDDIAKEAGLAKGLLYYYFKSKPELFQFVFKKLMEQAFEVTKMIVSEGRSLKDALGSYINVLLSSAFEQPMYPLAYKMMPDDFVNVFPNNASEIQQTFFNQFTGPMIERFSLAMDKGEIPKANPKLQAILFTSAVLAMSHLIASNPMITGGNSREQVVEETTQLLLYGIFKGT
jgi:AcrR family transcriptional regulator